MLTALLLMCQLSLMLARLLLRKEIHGCENREEYRARISSFLERDILKELLVLTVREEIVCSREEVIE